MQLDKDKASHICPSPEPWLTPPSRLPQGRGVCKATGSSYFLHISSTLRMGIRLPLKQKAEKVIHMSKNFIFGDVYTVDYGGKGGRLGESG